MIGFVWRVNFVCKNRPDPILKKPLSCPPMCLYWKAIMFALSKRVFLRRNQDFERCLLILLSKLKKSPYDMTVTIFENHWKYVVHLKFTAK